MKKVLIAIPFLFLAYKADTDKQRTYKIEIPESQIGAYWQLIHGQQDNMKVGEYKAILGTLETQIVTQANEYHLQDSLAGLKNKKDTTNKK